MGSLGNILTATDLSDSELAVQLGVSRETVWKWRRGRVLPSHTNLKQLWERFGENGERGSWETVFEHVGLPWPPEAKMADRWEFTPLKHEAGLVWTYLQPRPENRGIRHHFAVQWGPWEKNGNIRFDEHESVSLTFMKRDDWESVPITVFVNPACYVSFGHGHPTRGHVVDINHGWARISDEDIPHTPVTVYGQVVLPMEVREAMGLKTGDMLSFTISEGTGAPLAEVHLTRQSHEGVNRKDRASPTANQVQRGV